jgi:hypothetical protein
MCLTIISKSAQFQCFDPKSCQARTSFPASNIAVQSANYLLAKEVLTLTEAWSYELFTQPIRGKPNTGSDDDDNDGDEGEDNMEPVTLLGNFAFLRREKSKLYLPLFDSNVQVRSCG